MQAISFLRSAFSFTKHKPYFFYKKSAAPLEKIPLMMYIYKNTGSVLHFLCGIIPPPAPEKSCPADNDKLSLCSVATALRSAEGKDGYVHFCVPAFAVTQKRSKADRYRKKVPAEKNLTKTLLNGMSKVSGTRFCSIQAVAA